MALASFSLCFCVPASSLLFCDYYRFFHRFTTLFIANLCFFYCFVAVVYHEGILIYMCFPGMRSSFIRLFPHGRCYSLHFISFYTTEFNPWYNSFSFSLCFYWHLVSLLSHFCVVKTLLYFLRHFKFFKLFVASWQMLFIPWCCCCLSCRLLFIYLFSVCSIWLVFVTLLLFILLLFFGDNFGLVFPALEVP